MKKMRKLMMLVLLMAVVAVPALVLVGCGGSTAWSLNLNNAQFREVRAESQWFYMLGSDARTPSDAVLGHHGTAHATGTVVISGTTVTTFVSDLAVSATIEMSAMFADLDLLTSLTWNGTSFRSYNAETSEFTNNSLLNIYTTVDAGWGANVTPVYILAGFVGHAGTVEGVRTIQIAGTYDGVDFAFTWVIRAIEAPAAE